VLEKKKKRYLSLVEMSNHTLSKPVLIPASSAGNWRRDKKKKGVPSYKQKKG